MRRSEVPVLIVGAGPVGVFASLLLSRRGIENRVIERRSGPHRAPQAHVVNPRTLEICRRAGVDMRRLREQATPAQDGSHVRWLMTLTGEEFGAVPYERQGDENLEFTPTPLLNLSQHLFEPILLDHARAQQHANIDYGLQWTSLEQDDDGVTSVIENRDTGEQEEVRSRYVLAADGAGSRVRKSLGIEMVGPDAIQSFVMIHFRANLRALVKNRPAILYWIFDPASPGTFVAHDIDNTWVFMRPFDRESETIDDYDHERCRTLVRQAIGRDDVDLEIRDANPWTMSAQLAERYREGRVFMIGDSAHRFPPTGGMGMNTGIQDAHNLVWKLAMVLRGTAQASLLDTYETERRPIAEENSNQSLANAMKMFEVFEALGLTDDPGETRRNMSAVLIDVDSRERLRTAIEHQRDHFDMFGLQLGFSYETGAVISDGTERVVPDNPCRTYVPSTRPGARLPHAWVEVAGERVSTLDLIDEEGFTLIAEMPAAGWADEFCARADVAIKLLVVGRDFFDPDDHWLRSKGKATALLIRPDQHVAWRCSDTAVAPIGEIMSALGRLLGEPVI